MQEELIELQVNIKNRLLNAYKNNRLAHAYIFEGDKGVGKSDMAKFFQTLLYEYDANAIEQIKKDEFINVYNLYPDGKLIKKEQIVALQDEFSKTSQIEGPRIYVIHDADKMNQNSQNSLLKFIEEPNEGIYGILLTTNSQMLLPTIRSRCQILNFRDLDSNSLKEYLKKEHVGLKERALIPYLTNSKEEALEMSKSESFLALLALYEDFLSIDNIRKATIYLNKNITFFQDYDNLNNFFKILNITFEDVLYLNMQILDIKLYEFLDKISKLKERLTKEKTLEIITLIDRLQTMLRSNVSCKNVITNFFVNVF
jgi:DNA polymerase-3 subunit delta'